MRRTSARTIVLAIVALTLTACGLHVSKNGISGSIAGHNFSASQGALPAGFPSAIPVPDRSRVLGGGGSDSRWDVAFAGTGDVTTGATAYQAKFRSAGYSVTNVETGSTATPSTSGGSTSSTVTLTGSVFTATDPQWTVEVELGTTSSPTVGKLKAGEYAVNITAVPTSSTTTTG
jgi:hypothetical protein